MLYFYCGILGGGGCNFIMDFIVDLISNAELQTLSKSKIKGFDLVPISPTTRNIASANPNIQPPQPGQVRIAVFAIYKVFLKTLDCYRSGSLQLQEYLFNL